MRWLFLQSSQTASGMVVPQSSRTATETVVSPPVLHQLMPRCEVAGLNHRVLPVLLDCGFGSSLRLQVQRPRFFGQTSDLQIRGLCPAAGLSWRHCCWLVQLLLWGRGRWRRWLQECSGHLRWSLPQLGDWSPPGWRGDVREPHYLRHHVSCCANLAGWRFETNGQVLRAPWVGPWPWLGGAHHSAGPSGVGQLVRQVSLLHHAACKSQPVCYGVVVLHHLRWHLGADLWWIMRRGGERLRWCKIGLYRPKCCRLDHPRLPRHGRSRWVHHLMWVQPGVVRVWRGVWAIRS